VGAGSLSAHAADFADNFQQAINYDAGRAFASGAAASVTGIVVHWWGEPSGQTHQGVVDYLAGDNGAEVSAHYVVSNEAITQIVDLGDTAYHAGVYSINAQSIGIECCPEMDEGTLQRLRGLIQNLNGRFGPLWLEPHKAFVPTGCPGTYVNKIQELKILAAGSADQIPPTPGDPMPVPPEPDPGAGGNAPEDPATPPSSLQVDGWWGTSTTKLLQSVLGTPVDGVVSGQSKIWQAKNPGLVSGWQWVPEGSATGSEVIRQVQQKVGAEVDGLIGPNTIKAIQKHFGTVQDGCFSEQSSCIMALQKALNSGTF
jgi:CHAP domain protein